MIRIVIVEDNNTLRQSLEQLINRSGDIECVASLYNLMNVKSDISNVNADRVLMDIGLPNISGIEGVRTVKNSYMRIIRLSLDCCLLILPSWPKAHWMC